MRKFAFFVEGLSEEIFLKKLLSLITCYSVEIEPVKLYKSTFQESTYKVPNPDAKFYVLIINVGNDNKVLSLIRERGKKMIEVGGYEQIYAVRDMYSADYRKIAKIIDSDLNMKMEEEHHKTIQEFSFADKVRLYFAIMEVEAWFLGIINWSKINSSFTDDAISRKLNACLSAIDPETEFFKPSDIVNSIYEINGAKYSKSLDDVSAIADKVELEGIELALSRKIIPSFFSLYSEMKATFV